MIKSKAYLNRLASNKLAAQMWGQIQQSQRLANGIVWYSTASHGGIVVDTDIHPDVLLFQTKNFIYIRKGGVQGRIADQHFVALEEDCNASIAEWLYPDEIITPKYQQSFCGGKDISFDEWKAHRIDVLRSSLEKWNPMVLWVYPDAGMRRKDLTTMRYEFATNCKEFQTQNHAVTISVDVTKGENAETAYNKVCKMRNNMIAWLSKILLPEEQ